MAKAKKEKAAKPEKLPKSAKPRARVLPGMEQVRDTVLMSHLEAIGDFRERKNELIQDEAREVQAALRRMEDKGHKVYRHAGVEVALIPGDNHLRIRLVKEKANTDAPEEVGEGQDPAEIAESLTEGAGADE